jgi:hypothetical protein
VELIDKIKNLFRARPPTEEELAARAEVEVMRERASSESAEDHIRTRPIAVACPSVPR